MSPVKPTGIDSFDSPTSCVRAITVSSTRATTLATEQSVLFSVAQSFMDVVQNQAVLDLSINNEQVLRRELEATQDRFRVGEITRTDVAAISAVKTFDPPLSALNGSLVISPESSKAR